VWVFGRSLAGIVDSNPSVEIDVYLCCQVEISASGRSLVQRSPIECGVSEYDLEASIMKRP
jgi:hypothetical protein